MRLHKAKISNFASFGENQEIDFSVFGDEPVLIVGENRDEPGANSNGSGKSSLMHAISWALFGKLPTSVPVDEIVRLGTELGEVRLEIQDGSHQIQIHRYRDIKRKKRRGLTWMSDEGSMEFNTSIQAQEELSRRLGFHPLTAFTDFKNSAYFSMEAMTAFTSRSGKSEERMALIARFLGLDVLDTAKELARTKRTGLRSTVDLLRQQLSDLQDQIAEPVVIAGIKTKILAEQQRVQVFDQDQEIHSDNLRRAESRDRLEERHAATLFAISELPQKYDAETKELANQIQSRSFELGNQIKRRDELQAEMDAEAGEDVYTEEQIDEYLEETQREITRLVRERAETQAHKTHLEGENSRLRHQAREGHACPACATPLSIINGQIILVDPVKIKAAHDEREQEITKLDLKLEEIGLSEESFQDVKQTILRTQTEMRAQSRRLQEKQEVLSQIFQRTSSIDDQQKLLASAEERQRKEQDELGLRANELSRQLAEYDELPITTDIVKLIEKNTALIKESQLQILQAETVLKQHEEALEQQAKLQARLDGMSKEFEAAEFWTNGFPTIRRWRVDAFLPEFESEVNRFLRAMDVGMRVTLNTLRRKKKTRGDEDPTRAQFTIQVSDTYGGQRDIQTFSMGEARRIGMAVGFALRDLTINRGTNQMDFVLLDEVVDSLDALGTEAFFRLLPELSGPKFVISHDQDLASRFEHVVSIVKEDGISTISV